MTYSHPGEVERLARDLSVEMAQADVEAGRAESKTKRADRVTGEPDDLRIRLARAEEERRTALLALEDERRTLRTAIDRILEPASVPRQGLWARLPGT